MVIRMQQKQKAEIVKSILRMSQKAMGWTLAMIGVGFVGGLVAVCIRPALAEPISQYAQVFVPVFVAEIGMYGIGSTLEKLPGAKNTETKETIENG